MNSRDLCIPVVPCPHFTCCTEGWCWPWELCLFRLLLQAVVGCASLPRVGERHAFLLLLPEETWASDPKQTGCAPADYNEPTVHVSYLNGLFNMGKSFGSLPFQIKPFPRSILGETAGKKTYWQVCLYNLKLHVSFWKLTVLCYNIFYTD